MSLEECKQQLAGQLSKQEKERDIPMLLRLWGNKAFFEERRTQIATYHAGEVQELINDYPLLQQPAFVSVLSVFHNFLFFCRLHLFVCSMHRPDNVACFSIMFYLL